jgi:hypothetical protein
VRREGYIWQEANVEKEYSQLSLEEGHTAYGSADALLYVLQDIRSPRRHPIQMLLPRSLLHSRSAPDTEESGGNHSMCNPPAEDVFHSIYFRVSPIGNTLQAPIAYGRQITVRYLDFNDNFVNESRIPAP